MTARDRLNILIDQLPQEQVLLVGRLLKSILKEGKQRVPKGKLGLKKNFDRRSLYDEILAG